MISPRPCLRGSICFILDTTSYHPLEIMSNANIAYKVGKVNIGITDSTSEC